MTYTVLYLQRGMGSKDFRLVKPLIQVLNNLNGQNHFGNIWGWERLFYRLAAFYLPSLHVSQECQTTSITQRWPLLFPPSFLIDRVHKGNVNISYPENKPHFKDVVGGALLGGGLAYLSHSFLLARQSGPVTSATSTTSLLAVSTSRLYSREDLSVPWQEEDDERY